MSGVEAHYDANSAYEWERLQRHRTEFAVNRKAMGIYLPPPPATVLDIGGGPGRYAIALTDLGYAVTMLDLSEGNLEVAKVKAAEAGVSLDATIHGNATNLPRLPYESYDAVLLLGPLYHLLTKNDRSKAVCEAWRMLKTGGMVFAAVVTRYAAIRYAAVNEPEWILNDRSRMKQILESGQHPAEPERRHPDFYFVRPEEFKPLMESSGFETLNLIGSEGVVAGHEDRINQLEGTLWESWVDLNFRLGQEPSLHGAADHLLYIGQKPPANNDR